jgi:predicted O-methyltransferase YrrM
MYSPFTMSWKYIRYLLTADNGRGHGIHSPFVYQLIREVFMDQKKVPAYELPEQYRQTVLHNRTLLDIEDLGAGSVGGSRRKRSVASIASNSVKHQRYASLLFRLGNFLKARRILELGTSLGVTSMYLASVSTAEEVVTMEGSSEVADQAEAAFRARGLDKIRVVRGNFDDRLPELLQTMTQIELAYVDGNHRKNPTLDYFNQILPLVPNEGCIVFDDIHWSREMEEAWAEICADQRVTLTIDLFAIGLVFVRKEQLEKQHFTIRY